jgi:RNA polymerase sigma-70 factor (ECF subfamily)
MRSSQLTMTEPHLPAPRLEDFDGVVRCYRPRIFRYLLLSLRDRDAAENLTQECFLKAFAGRRGFRGESKLSTWLMQIAINLVRDQARSRRFQFWKRTQELSVDMDHASDWVSGGETSPEAMAVTKERVESVWRAVRTLSEGQKTVFILRFVEDMEVLEIAEATGMKEGTVKSQLFRATETIRRRLGR